MVVVVVVAVVVVVVVVVVVDDVRVLLSSLQMSTPTSRLEL